MVDIMSEFDDKHAFAYTGAKSNFLSENYLNRILCLKKCEFCQKWVFEIVNVVKKETLKLWI